MGVDYSKRVDRMIEEYGLSDKLPMAEEQLRRYRGIGGKTLQEFRRRGLVRPDPFQWLRDIHPKLPRICGYQFRDRDELVRGIKGGMFKVLTDSSVQFCRFHCRGFNAADLKTVCDLLAVPFPDVHRPLLKKTIEGCVGAHVMFCGHNGWFVADIYRVADAVVIRANGPIRPDNLVRGKNAQATHHVSDFPTGGFWRPDLGVLVVPWQQVKKM